LAKSGVDKNQTAANSDNSGKDLLGVAHLVEIDNDSTFHDVLADLPSEVTDRELIEVKLREFEGSPDSESLTLRQGLLSKTLSEIDDILEQHRKCRPGHAALTVRTASIQRPSPAAASVNTHNAFARLASAGQAAYRRNQFVTEQQVQAWFSSDTPKGNLALALRQRLEQLGAGFFSNEAETFRRKFFTKLVQVLWCVTPKLVTSFESDLSQAGTSASKAQSVAVLQAACGMLLDDELGSEMSSDALPDASATADAEPSADSSSHAREFAHGASADPEDAGIADAANGAAATQSSRKHAHSCMLAMDRAKKCSLHGPGAFVYDEVEAACESGQYSCGAVLMPPGHQLDSEVYCNVALTCAAPVETTLYGMSKSAISLPLVQFNQGLCSVCGVEQVPGDALKQQGCSGNTAKSWSVYPLCEACAVQGIEATSVRKTKAKSKRSARAKKRARPAPAARYNRSVSASE
jgi:hypothetical protein